MFSVKKPKNSTLRLILGCRNSSLHFERPPDVSLLAAEGFGNIEVGEGLEELEAAAFHGGVADVQDCFHNLKMP